MRPVFLLLLLLLPFPSHGSEFKIVRNLTQGQQTDEAIRLLVTKTETSKDQNVRSLAWFGLGVLYFDSGRDQDSQRAMYEALNQKTRLDDFAHQYLGLSLRRSNNKSEAKREFQKVLAYKPTSQRYLDAKMNLGEMALEEKDFREAKNHFGYLERKTRRTPRYSGVVLSLIHAEMGLKSRFAVCKWMRQLYVKYPGDPALQSWGLDLHQVEIAGQKTGCMAGPNDFKTRIRNLQHAGLSQKARGEIDLLRKRAAQFTHFYVDMILANFLITDGHVDEAFKILVPYYSKRQSDFQFLMLMAKAAARAGEFHIAAGAYLKAYQVSPGSRKGREALFQAAFLSYQSQDYDGAAVKFEDFLKKFQSSGLSRDAMWYLSWISYLKEDYGQAFERFSKMGNLKTRRGRVVFTQDRIDYWRAMSLMKGGRLVEAKKIFEAVGSDRLLGYYSIASQARLETLKELLKDREPSSVVAVKTPIAENAKVLKTGIIADTLNPVEAPPAGDAESGEVTQVKAATEDEEAESGLQTSEADESEDADAATDQPEELVAEGEALPLKTGFADPRLADRFKRASDLSDLGFTEWARWELYEIEKRTRNREYLKMLMTEYEMVGAYNRASSLAQIDFGPQRSRLGLDRGRWIWQYSYPKAFEKTVSNFSRSFRTSQELIWSIMRAESRYKADVVSPVGALGLMQMMPYTGERVAALVGIQGFQPQMLLEPDLNIRLGTRYLSRLGESLNGQIPLIAAAYNAGPHRVSAWLKAFGHLEMDEFVEHIPFFETRNYVKKVVHNYFVYSSLYSKDGKKPLVWLTQPSGVRLEGPVPTRENWDI